MSIIKTTARGFERVDIGGLPPCALVAGAIDCPVIGAAQRYSEFVARLAAERPRLHAAKMMRSDGSPVLKSGFCVSTVSIVCGRAPGSMAVVLGCTY